MYEGKWKTTHHTRNINRITINVTPVLSNIDLCVHPTPLFVHPNSYQNANIYNFFQGVPVAARKENKCCQNTNIVDAKVEEVEINCIAEHGASL